jgi:hypothetical protein
VPVYPAPQARAFDLFLLAPFIILPCMEIVSKNFPGEEEQRKERMTGRWGYASVGESKGIRLFSLGRDFNPIHQPIKACIASGGLFFESIFAGGQPQ